MRGEYLQNVKRKSKQLKLQICANTEIKIIKIKTTLLMSSETLFAANLLIQPPMISHQSKYVISYPTMQYSKFKI